MEGKDVPHQAPPKAYDVFSKTIGLLMRLTHSMWHTGCVVLLDSRFCVLQGIVELCKKGVFAAAQIKKQYYWPKHIPGDAVVLHFATNDVGHIDALQGQPDGVPFHVFCMKEEDYVSMLMSTYGTHEWMGNEKYRKWMDGSIRRVKYPEVVHNHFRYQHLINDHNSKRHQPISLEVVWATQEWS